MHMHSCIGKGAGTAVLKYVAPHASHLTLITIKLYTFVYLVSFLESQYRQAVHVWDL